MFNPKQILVPVDFSPSSYIALQDAASLAKNYGAQLDVVHVWELPMLVSPEEVAGGSGLPPVVIDAVSSRAHDTLERFVANARAKGIAIRNAQALPGEPYRTIVEVADAGHYDAIVIGTHGRKRLARVLLGSVAERVVRHASCPVLVARAKLEDLATPSTNPAT
jgi:nucleotide-binding universal stress UspA family protein